MYPPIRVELQHIQPDSISFTAALGPMSNGSAWAAYLATMADIKACTGADSILNAFNGLCRSDFDGLKIPRESDADLLRQLDGTELRQLHRLLETQAGFVKPISKGSMSYTSQVFRRSIFERVAPLIQVLANEQTMRKVLLQHATENESPTTKIRRKSSV